MLTVATPSTGWLLGYDTDGFLKQKDSTGIITQIGVGGTVSFSSGTPSLVEVLKIGNTTGTYSIVMGTQTIISTSNGNSYLSLDDSGSQNEALLSINDGVDNNTLYLAPNFSSIDSKRGSTYSQILLDSTSITQNVSYIPYGLLSSSAAYFTSLATASYYRVSITDDTLSTTTVNILESGSTYDSGTAYKAFLHLNSRNASTLNGVENSVIIGGQNMTADENDTVYLPQVIIRDGDRIKAGAGYGLLEFNQYNDAILSTNKLTDNSIIGIFSSTSSSTHISGKNGILVRDTLTSSTSPSWQSAITFISTEFSSVDMGVYNSVVIGGNNLSATQSNTVYLGNNVNINNSYYLPTSDGSSTQVLHTDGSGNLYWNTVTAQVSTFSLHDVLVQQNDSIDRNIIMGTGTYIESGNSGSRIIFDDGLVSGNIVISTNNGSLFDSYIDMDQSDITISTPNILNLNFNDASIVSNGLKGLEYGFDYSATFVTHSLVDKNYVDTNSLSSVDNTSIELNINNEVSLKSSIDGNRQFNDSVTILGNLVVQGTTSTINTENLFVEDNFITLNATYSGPAIDTGIEANLGDGTYSKILWSSGSGYWQAGLSGSESTILTQTDNGLSKVGDSVILGGTISQNTIINGENYDLEINGLNTILMTASQYIDETVNDGSVYSQNYVEITRNTLWSSTVDNATYSRVRTSLTGGESNLQLMSYSSNYGSSTILILSTGSNINDGSTNNSIVVTDTINQKGIVYSDDYSSNFTTYSLVTKQYVDSSLSTPSNGLEYISTGVIGLGGTLSLGAIIAGEGKNLYLDNLGRISMTSSIFNDIKVTDSNEFSQNYVTPNMNNSLTSTLDGFTYSRFRTTFDSAAIASSTNTSTVGILLTSTNQNLSDGSSNNNIVVTDSINQKGIVYSDDYTSNFTTYSVVTKGYVDTFSTSKFSTIQSFTASVTETINHNLGTDEIIVQCYDSSGVMVIPGTVQTNGTNDVDITFSIGVTNIKIVVIG